MTQGQGPPGSDLHKPRVLCLHGGGVNAQVFRIQCRALIRGFEGTFRLVFADGAFDSEPHPAILPFYEGMGPYKRWLNYLPDRHPSMEDAEAGRLIENALKKSMDEDSKSGADGDWVGIIGFSQGAKIAASVLFDSQLRAESSAHGEAEGANGALDEPTPTGFAGGHWRFAVCMAGRPPLIGLSSVSIGQDGIAGAGGIPEMPTPDAIEVPMKVSWPTVHVHGLADPGLEYHRILFKKYCDDESAELVEWNGGHRVVLKIPDVENVVDATIRAAKKAGVLQTFEMKS